MAAKMQLVYFLLIICVISTIECGVRYKRDDEPEENQPGKEAESEPTTTETVTSDGGQGGKYPFIPKEVQAWFGEFGNKFPGGGPNKWFEQAGSIGGGNKWFEQAGSIGGGNKWVEDAGSFFSKAPWARM